MDETGLRSLVTVDGFFTRAEAWGWGLDDRALRSGVRRGVLRRIRHGAYTFADVWNAADPVAQHLLRARAAVRAYGGPVALSHTTAAAALGLDLWAADLTRIHLIRLDGGSGGVIGDVVVHTGSLDASTLVACNGFRVTPAARTVVDHASVVTLESGLVTADSALHRGCVAPDQLASAYDDVRGWPGMRRVSLVVRLADGLAGSAGESRSRFLFWRFGIPRPVLQHRVLDEWGALIGITDFVWHEHRTLGEFDGRAKYGRLLRPGQDPGSAVFEEKRREDRLRERTGYSMVRLVWSDLNTPQHTADRVRAMLTRAA